MKGFLTYASGDAFSTVAAIAVAMREPFFAIRAPKPDEPGAAFRAAVSKTVFFSSVLNQQLKRDM